MMALGIEIVWIIENYLDLSWVYSFILMFIWDHRGY